MRRISRNPENRIDTHPNIPRPLVDLGGCRARLIVGGRFRLDGGAMFGIIPKPMWSRRIAADSDNHIALACNCLLIEWDGAERRVLVEVGHGAKYGDKEQGFFGIDPNTWLLPALTRAAVDPLTITDIVLTHLHFDHAGGLTQRIDGRLTATFPRATVHVQRQEFDDARANFGIMTNTYREENFAPIDAQDCWRLLDGDVDVFKGAGPAIRVIRTPGHTRGHQTVIVAGRDRTLAFVGDVMPTRHHVGRPYNMGYDLLPLENRESKTRLLAAAAEQRWLLALDHDPDEPLVTAARDKDWFVLEPA